MDVPDKPADPNEVELTEVDKKTPPEKKMIVNVNITFCTHVGWDGVLVMLFSLGIAGLFVYITFLYTKKFQAWHREVFKERGWRVGLAIKIRGGIFPAK